MGSGFSSRWRDIINMTEGNPHNRETAAKVTCKEDSENKPLLTS